MKRNPATKNGFIRIANELAEVFAKTSISGSDVRILWVVMRKTWGWVNKSNGRRKDVDQIALSQFVEATGMKQVNVVRSLKSLVACKLLEKTDRGYGLNQDYSQWVVEKRVNRLRTSEDPTSSLEATSLQASSQNDKSSSLQATKSSSLQATYKRKERNIQKKMERVVSALTPKEETKNFFEGVKDLLEKKPVPWLSEMLTNLAERNPNVDKRKIWAEVVAFCGYWTERDQNGRQEKWQLQKTFEVWHRLTTWFRNAKFKDFQGSSRSGSKGRGLVE